jgi:hypothetical protein
VFISLPTVQSSHVKSIFYGPEEDDQYDQSVEQYQDPLDRLEFPESPSLDDDDYEPGDDDNEGDDDDDGDDEGIDGDEGVHGHNLDESPTCVRSLTSHKRPQSDSLDSNNGKYEKARKIVRSSGRPKASDYAQEVQDVLRVRLCFRNQRS